MKLLFISLGCDKNRVDSETMLSLIVQNGMELTDDETEADIIVINTCCFIGDAKEESINTILEMAEYKRCGSCRALIVTGCLAQRYQDEIHNEISEVDAILGTNSIDSICEAIDSVLSMNSSKDNTHKCKQDDGTKLQGTGTGYFYKKLAPLCGLPQANHQLLTTPGHYAYLKIAEGCDKNCTYCVIPSVRGHYRSVPMERLLADARDLAAGGVKELILVAQETTLYGTDLYGQKSLHVLLDELNKIPGIMWIRILYCYPEEIYEELLDSMIRNEKVCHYLDIPIQHCNDTLLRRMGRRTNRRELVSQIEHIRERIPDIVLRTTLICGFPGETEAMHEELMQFVNDMEFDRLGAFEYSQEEGTPAAEFANQVPDETKSRWAAEVMELQEEVSLDCNEDQAGRELVIMIEGRVTDDASDEYSNVFDDERESGGNGCPDADDLVDYDKKYTYVARSYRDAPDVDGFVFIRSDEELMTGDVCKARIVWAHEYDLMGEIIPD